MALGAGCAAPPAAPPARDILPRPFSAVPVAQRNAMSGLDQWLAACRGEGQELQRDIILRYFSNRREFRDPPGPDGYLLCVTVLDRQLRPAPVAELTIGLFDDSPAARQDLGRRPLRVWQVHGARLEETFSDTDMLDCYALPLDWGPQPLPPGSYLFCVVAAYRHGDDVQNAGEILMVEDDMPRRLPEEETTP